ncbi:cysteine synthase family protein [Paenibacillus sp. SC116]|uniref:cysteine synthase family protein n=1 Tax=Paenibacillus sp. SC116 TaxID=2968986 RepID=UPI00215AE0C8|nr:cysteine synthase family protein [Paenibacillus sp. SC116]MCR8844957.1 cysteine synthase family protein [Paenibacillus sp. SC116]
MLRANMIDVIGDTPLVKLLVNEQTQGEVYAKLELLNPFGMKDRVAKQSILAAKRSGELQDGVPIIESSSGTMACGVALVGTYLGHDVHIVTDPRIDPITLAKLTSLGCHVHVVDKMGEQGWQSARLQRLSELLEEYPNAYWPRQYENPENPAAYVQLAHELISDLGQVDILVGSVGSGGSLCGTALELKKYNPNLKVIAVDAAGSVIFGQPDRPGRLQGGLGNSLIAPNVNHAIVDEVHWLNDEEAFSATLNLAKQEKIFAGNSSGSVYAVARWVSTQVQPRTKIAAVFPDRGDRYVDTIYNVDYRLEKNISNLEMPGGPNKVPYGTVVSSWSYACLKEAYIHAQ